MPSQQTLKALRSFISMNKNRCLRISGTSMTPYLNPGDKVYLTLTDPENLIPGKCYAFFNGDRLILHRLISIMDGLTLFMGDNMTVPHYIAADKIIGKLEIANSSITDNLIESISRIFKNYPRIRRRLIRIIILSLNNKRRNA